MRRIFIPLCLKAPVRYSFNILMIIALLYHRYIEYEIYNLAYNTKKILYESLFKYGKMDKWDDVVTFLEIIRNMGHSLYVNL